MQAIYSEPLQSIRYGTKLQKQVSCGGTIVGMAYLLENGHQFESGNMKSVVCTASTDCTIRTWDVQEGCQLWASSSQEAPIATLNVISEYGLIISVDTEGRIKVWKGQTGEELATFLTSSPSCKLATYIVDNKAFLIAGTGEGALYTLTIPNLCEVSQVPVFETYKISLVLPSPDKQWILAATTENLDIFPKVIYTKHLIDPPKDDPPFSDSLLINGCTAACWLPTDAARIAVAHTDIHSLSGTKISTFDIKLKKTKYQMKILAEQVGSFTLPLHGLSRDVILESRGTDCLVIAHGAQLELYSISGTQLARFKDHREPITAICLDSFRVVTSSMDLSLRVYTWKRQKDKTFSLESRYHLLGGSHMQSRGFSNVACNYVSIAGSVAAKDGRDVVKAYSFQL
ncbi:F-box/WD repeat-containing protein 12 isoform X2 [Latimeria chalumnae]|uniref:F-box/WD repeat-containing protein 12 isoform X2 n=1 Tax=Latimeria chalumnae TaxID=7897 RepID=UPI0006D90EC6|nr:PREDICTED: F-box/WD repeat-containing protein 12 isoform X2 [Latimeria chalumnae]|eukprot:XP_014353637.1 PREDICTED: F-box/WD repeat-containing protein 12 isoform X2 [Latimeria chalumnae]